jgi:prephenate dehydrogenase
MSKNILILGNGFIGKNLYSYFVSKYNTTITSKKDIDITKTESVKNYLSNKNFDYVIYSIGIKDIAEYLGYCKSVGKRADLESETKKRTVTRKLVHDGGSGNVIRLRMEY